MKRWIFLLVMILVGACLASDYHYIRVFNRCDSVRWIKEFNGVADTVIWTDTTRIDTTIPAAQFDSLGLYHFIVELLYQDESEWVGGEDDYVNTYAASGVGSVISIVATTDTFITTVYGKIVKLGGAAVEGATVRFSITPGNVFREYDSSVVFTFDYTDQTDTLGVWQVEVPASNRLFYTKPTTDTVWYNVRITYGAMSREFKHQFIPDTTSIKFPDVKL